MFGVSLFSDTATVIDGINVAGGIESTFTFTTIDEAMAFEEAAHAAGFNYLYGSGGTVHFSNVIGGSGQYGLSAVETTGVATTANTTAVTATGLEADAGLALVDGGVTVGVQAAALGGAVIAGAGLGYASYKLYPEFWTDLSEGLADGLGGNEVMPVILRATEQGGIQQYCRKNDVDKILDNLYNLTKMNPDFDLEITEPGTYPFQSGLDFNQTNVAIADAFAKNPGAVITPPATGAETFNRTMDLYRSHYPGGPEPNWMVASAGIGDYYGTRVSQVRCQLGYAEPNPVTIVLETGADGRTYIRTTQPVNGNFVDHTDLYRGDGSYNRSLGTSYSASSQLSGGTWAEVTSDSATSHCGSLGGDVSANPAIIYNNQTKKSNDREHFWDVFSNWRARGWTKHGYNPFTKQNEDEEYLPIETPQQDPDEDVETSPQDQTRTQEGVATQTILDYLVQNLNKVINNYTWINVPSEPIGPTPTPTPPSQVFDGAGLWAIYNPTKAQINALGAYLWSSNIVDIIEKFFKNSPLEAIISLHMIYCTPTTGANQNIILGYLDSGVSSKTVTNQYESIDCGTITVNEHFGDARDYVNTTVEIFLPFVGIRSLNTADIVGSQVNLKYTVDVLTGTVLAQLFITKSGITQCLYQYEGNCAVQIPLTSADKSRLVSGMVSSLASAVGMGAAGGPAGAVAGAIGGAVNSLAHNTTIQRTGGLSGNSGAMALKTPYIIITRKKANQMGNYYKNMGAAACYTQRLGDLTGFTVVKSVRLDTLNCTDSERDMIESQLKSGIII